MIVIDKNYLLSKPRYSWLEKKLEPNFKIVIDDKSKIIFGFNGIGKTSFSKCLQEDTTNNFKFLDYENESQKPGEKEIKISPYIYKIEELTRKIDEDSLSIDFQVCSKTQGFKKTAASKGPQFLKSFVKSLSGGPATIKKTDIDYSTFVAKYPNVNPSIVFEISIMLDSVINTQNEIDNFKKIKYKELLENVKQFVGSNKTTCPVCGSTVSDIETIIDSKINVLSTLKSDLVSHFEQKGYPYSSAILDEYLKLYSEIKADSDLLNDFIVCGKDISRHTLIGAQSQTITNDKRTLGSLQAMRTNKYNDIKRFESRFKKDVAKYLKISETNILFDDSFCEITIKFDRESNTYSTGERHILWFLVELYSFLGSDSSTLILDDPVSSLDLLNMYKIAFEIVEKASKITSKNIVVFTHSVDLVNAINSQHPGEIDVYYLEEFKGLLYCDEISYRINNAIPNVIDVERLSGYSPKIADSLKERDFVGASSQEHQVYHYSVSPYSSRIDASLTNKSLVDRIDSFSGFTKVDFYQDSFNKILYLLSLRVWIEKELYNLIPLTENTRQLSFLSEETLNSKIKVLQNTGSFGTDLLSLNNIDKGELMSKKVMLNQNAHYFSQVMPFAFAINLSLDDLEQEIKNVKSIFHK